MDFRLIPTPSLDFQVALNLGETAPLNFHVLGPFFFQCSPYSLFIINFQFNLLFILILPNT